MDTLMVLLASQTTVAQLDAAATLLQLPNSGFGTKADCAGCSPLAWSGRELFCQAPGED